MLRPQVDSGRLLSFLGFINQSQEGAKEGLQVYILGYLILFLVKTTLVYIKYSCSQRSSLRAYNRLNLQAWFNHQYLRIISVRCLSVPSLNDQRSNIQYSTSVCQLLKSSTTPSYPRPPCRHSSFWLGLTNFRRHIARKPNERKVTSPIYGARSYPPTPCYAECAGNS